MQQKKLTTLYPGYFPNLRWWQKWIAADVVVILDNLVYRQSLHINRTWIKTVVGKTALVVPVLHSKNNRINQAAVDVRKNWRRSHQASLVSNYRNTPYFDYYFPHVNDLLQKPQNKLIDLNMAIIYSISGLLRLKKTIHYYSEAHPCGSREERVLQLLQHYHCNTYVIEANSENYFDENILRQHGVSVKMVKPNSTVYEQQFGSFVQGLSILDIILNEGPHSIQIVKDFT